MPCPHCAAPETAEQPRRTALGYRTFRCGRCRRACNERTGTPYNHLQFPTDLVLLVVLWRLRYKLSLRDLAEMFLARGLAFSHEAVRDWEARFAPLIAARLRAKRRGQAGVKWHADETYVRVNGAWCYLYRAIDRESNLVEALLSEKRDMAAAQRFFAQALNIAGGAPERVTTDGHDAYPRAIRSRWGQGCSTAVLATTLIRDPFLALSTSERHELRPDECGSQDSHLSPGRGRRRRNSFA